MDNSEKHSSVRDERVTMIYSLVCKSKETTHKIKAIKALRNVTSLGLREAKEAIEKAVKTGSVCVNMLSVEELDAAFKTTSGELAKREGATRVLRELGFVFEMTSEEIWYQLEALANKAAVVREFKLASDLFAILSKKKGE